MKAVTLVQPHATLVALGARTIVTTEHPTDHRGPLAIHAGQIKADPRDPAWMPLLVEPTSARLRPEVCPLPLGAVVATARLLDVVPIVEDCDDLPDPVACVEALPRCLRFWPANAVELGEEQDISDQLPYGDFTPGRFAWLLDDVKVTEQRCPRCWGRGNWLPEETERSPMRAFCGLCDGSGVCPPVPAKGHPGLWTWEP